MGALRYQPHHNEKKTSVMAYNSIATRKQEHNALNFNKVSALTKGGARM